MFLFLIILLALPNHFYRNAKRTNTGAVDFEHMEEDLNWFENANKTKEKVIGQMNKLESKIDVNYTLTVFLEKNTHSQSY